MPKHPNLTRSGPQGIFRFRRRVPDALRPVVGKLEVVISLRTADAKVALGRYHDVARRVEEQFAAAEKKRLSGDTGKVTLTVALPPTAEALEALCKRHRDAVIAVERGHRADITQRALADQAAFQRGEIITLPVEVAMATITDAKSGRGHASVAMTLSRIYQHAVKARQAQLRAMLAAQDDAGLRARFEVHAPTGYDATVGRALAAAELAALDHIIAADLTGRSIGTLRALGVTDRASDTAGSAATAAQPSASAPSDDNPLLSTAVAAWVAANTTGRVKWSAERHGLCEVVLGDMVHVCGDRPLSTYRKADGRAMVEILRQLPANVVKRKSRLGVGNRDLRKLAAAAKAEGLPPQADSNVNKKLAIISQCFRWLRAHYDACPPCPVDGMKLGVRTAAKDQKQAFTVEQLNVLFNAPVYVGCESERHWHPPGSIVLRQSPKFWLPLLALFTGARSNELCRLERRHVCEHDGIHYLLLDESMRLKNDASVRSVPRHPTLIELGFIDFVQTCDGRLFEPPRVCRRLELLREWSHDESKEVLNVFPRSA